MPVAAKEMERNCKGVTTIRNLRELWGWMNGCGEQGHDTLGEGWTGEGGGILHNAVDKVLSI